MRIILKLGSFAGLGLTVVPAFLVFAGKITFHTHAVLMGIGALVWFATAPFWMVEAEPAHEPNEE